MSTIAIALLLIGVDGAVASAQINQIELTRAAKMSLKRAEKALDSFSIVWTRTRAPGSNAPDVFERLKLQPDQGLIMLSTLNESMAFRDGHYRLHEVHWTIATTSTQSESGAIVGFTRDVVFDGSVLITRGPTDLLSPPLHDRVRIEDVNRLAPTCPNWYSAYGSSFLWEIGYHVPYTLKDHADGVRMRSRVLEAFEAGNGASVLLGTTSSDDGLIDVIHKYESGVTIFRLNPAFSYAPVRIEERDLSGREVCACECFDFRSVHSAVWIPFYARVTRFQVNGEPRTPCLLPLVIEDMFVAEMSIAEQDMARTSSLAIEPGTQVSDARYADRKGAGSRRFCCPATSGGLESVCDRIVATFEVPRCGTKSIAQLGLGSIAVLCAIVSYSAGGWISNLRHRRARHRDLLKRGKPAK